MNENVASQRGIKPGTSCTAGEYSMKRAIRTAVFSCHSGSHLCCYTLYKYRIGHIGRFIFQSLWLICKCCVKTHLILKIFSIGTFGRNFQCFRQFCGSSPARVGSASFCRIWIRMGIGINSKHLYFYFFPENFNVLLKII